MPVTVTESQGQALALASVALDEQELAQAIKRTLLINHAAQILCRHYSGKAGCHCNSETRNCHAHMLWEDEARAIVQGYERIGAFK